jgi:hypothetical protein
MMHNTPWMDEDDAIIRALYVEGGARAVANDLAMSGRPERTLPAIRQRANAIGVKRHGEARAVPVTVRLSERTVALLDAARGNTSRSAYVARVLRQHLAVRSPY